MRATTSQKTIPFNSNCENVFLCFRFCKSTESKPMLVAQVRTQIEGEDTEFYINLFYTWHGVKMWFEKSSPTEECLSKQNFTEFSFVLGNILKVKWKGRSTVGATTVTTISLELGITLDRLEKSSLTESTKSLRDFIDSVGRHFN